MLFYDRVRLPYDAIRYSVPIGSPFLTYTTYMYSTPLNKKHYFLAKHDCVLALRTRNGGFKNSFTPGGTLPTHLVAPMKWKCDMMGFLTNTFQYLTLN